MEKDFQHQVDAMLKRTDVVPGTVQFPRDLNGEYTSSVKGSGQFRYVVAKRDAGGAVVLTQVRVRWWAFNRDNLEGITLDQERVVAQVVFQESLW